MAHVSKQHASGLSFAQRSSEARHRSCIVCKSLSQSKSPASEVAALRCRLTEAAKPVGVALTALVASACVSLSSRAVIDIAPVLDPSNPVLDLARVVPEVQEKRLVESLKDLQERSGWKLRLLTRNGPQQGPTGEEIRRAWQYDSRTAIVLCDPTSPNILQFQAGDEVTQILRRGFFIELQSRYGNLFYVRDEGEGAAVVNTIETMVECFERGGCAVVPGLPENQYELTLITSLIGGCVFGFSTTLRPQGFVQRRFIWPLLFAPLWGTLFISFGIGPIITRTQDRLPILYNFIAFAVAAAIFRLSPLFKSSAVDFGLISKEGRRKQDEKDASED